MQQTNEWHWFRRLAGEAGSLRKISDLVNNKILVNKLGVKVVRSDSFMVTPHWVYQLLYFSRLFNLIENVKGDVVECGVAWGASLCQIIALTMEGTTKRHIWGFDSFEGLPALSKEDLDCETPMYKNSKGKLVVKEDITLRNLRNFGLDEDFIKNHVTLVKGWFSETLPKYNGSPIAFLHLDPDLYESYKTALGSLWSKMSVGGIVSVDAYQATNILPGCKKAVDEFIAEHEDAIIKRSSHYPMIDRYYIVKKS